jgi:hypothetical protein
LNFENGQYLISPKKGEKSVTPGWQEELNIHFRELGFVNRRQLGRSRRVFAPFRKPGANPTIANYNASVVNFYDATGSLVRFLKKNIFFYFETTLHLTKTLALKLVGRIGSRRQSYDFELQRQRCKILQRNYNSMERF